MQISINLNIEYEKEIYFGTLYRCYPIENFQFACRTNFSPEAVVRYTLTPL